MPVALISGIAAFATLTSVAAWLIFLASAGFIAWGIIREEVYKKMMPKLPKKYTPVIGSLNFELIEYAGVLGKTIPNPDECIATVKGYDQVVNDSTPKVQPVVENAAFANNTTVQSNFCRKCGTQLLIDTVFCNKCGAKVEEISKNYDVCIFDSSTHTLRKENRDIDIRKFPPSKFADNDTYYAIETFRDGKKVRIYHTKDNWNKQIEIGISEEDK
jgi:ribosomal protein L40E